MRTILINLFLQIVDLCHPKWEIYQIMENWENGEKVKKYLKKYWKIEKKKWKNEK